MTRAEGAVLSQRMYLRDEQLEQSPVVANSRMNRERELTGTNGYTSEIGVHPLAFLQDTASKTGQAVRWLDLCCGTGRALIEAAAITQQQELPVVIVGVDLVGMFGAGRSPNLTLIEASLATWNASGSFDLITCVHGLHYIGDKLGLLKRECAWLAPRGLLIASLDLENLRMTPGDQSKRVFANALRRAGIKVLPSRRIIRCEGRRLLSLPFTYLGADDQAGPNYTGQPAVNSYYAQQ